MGPEQQTGNKGCKSVLVPLHARETDKCHQLINQVGKILGQDASECLILEGYSQGATVVVDALRQLTGPSFDAVKGVFLIGDTRHEPGLACNVDMQGGDKTKDATGLLYEDGNGIPQNWVSKTIDVCNVVRALPPPRPNKPMTDIRIRATPSATATLQTALSSQSNIWPIL